ncbi:predicted protein [Streptomyces viridosporus ATCC 14672]|uniref:Predicted protein n=1 Tax=Streptomyces viridosporus (strain ATCC 14672 / DSM 40746 / JCM 4963 / KCTC 9882 / NRRL B-12104 / FH 1290) TaxID=566461 RepID=D6A8Z9_STRV1|nr:predicted protein [Streptomyces viridosporus ATCC 14672]
MIEHGLTPGEPEGGPSAQPQLITGGRLVDQHSDLLLSCRRWAALVIVERPSTARGGPGRALMREHRIRSSILA